MVSPALSTVPAIVQKVRHLTNSPGENSLATTYIYQTLNDIYNTDFAYAIKIDQQRSVYTFYTTPNIDRYPIDVNYNMGIRAPAYIDGIKGSFFKDRAQFFNLWPKLATEYQPFTGDGSTVDIPDFTIAAPFLSNEVMIGGVDTSGNPITIRDDGNGNLYLINANAQTFTPALYTNPGVPGQHNGNLGNPGLYNSLSCGTVNYVSGVFSVDFTGTGVIPGNGEIFTLRVSQYQTGKPYAILFWNNELTVRPVPDKIHKIELETFMTPVQFLQTTDHPLLNQWWKYLAYLVSAEIQRERNDFDAVKELQEGAKRQEALVLERQGVEEIGYSTPTMFNSPTAYPYLNNNWGQGWL